MKARVVTVSDRVSRGEAEDTAGPTAQTMLADVGFEADRVVVPDGVESVSTALRDAVGAEIPLVVTTGGTGVAPRDLTPEATRAVIEREVPGLVEAMRSATFGVNPHGMLSRGVAGVAGSTLVVNLPGSVRAVEESLAVIAPALSHAVSLVVGGPSSH